MDIKPYKSKQWFDFRKSVIAAKSSTCEECGIGPPAHIVFQVHHPIYRDDAWPWEYELHEVMLVCRGCHAKLHGHIQPSSGWSLVYEDVLDEKDGVCDCCGRAIRFIYQIDHPDWSTMTVGSGCCDRLTETSAGTERKLFLAKLTRFSSQVQWKQYGDEYQRKYKGFSVTISKYSDHWKLKISSKTGTLRYTNRSNAERAALERIEIQLSKDDG
jgi:hypothetical protein